VSNNLVVVSGHGYGSVLKARFVVMVCAWNAVVMAIVAKARFVVTMNA